MGLHGCGVHAADELAFVAFALRSILMWAAERFRCIFFFSLLPAGGCGESNYPLEPLDLKAGRLELLLVDF